MRTGGSRSGRSVTSDARSSAEATEAAELERDRRIVAGVAARRRAEGKPWTAEIEAQMLADRAARRRTTD
jgi:hypothetical protein